MMVWVDLETTGLSDVADFILEVGIVVTTDELEPINSASMVLQLPGPAWYMSVDDVVKKMHDESGLWDQVEVSHITKKVAEKYLLQWLEDAGLKPGEHPMCGSSVGFDRRFLARHMPELEAWFHYRNIDVSTVKELSRRWDGPKYKSAGKAAHRALPDLINSIAELEFYLESGFLQPNPPVVGA